MTEFEKPEIDYSAFNNDVVLHFYNHFDAIHYVLMYDRPRNQFRVFAQFDDAATAGDDVMIVCETLAEAKKEFFYFITTEAEAVMSEYRTY